jgi:hypothetical protein
MEKGVMLAAEKARRAWISQGSGLRQKVKLWAQRVSRKFFKKRWFR